MKFLLLSFLLMNTAFAMNDYHYLDTSNIDLNSIPVPTKEDSDLVELTQLKELIKTRTEEDCKKALSQSARDPAVYFGPPDGPLSKEQLDKVRTIAMNASFDLGQYVKILARFYQRNKPYERDATIRSCASQGGDNSFPSHHAAYAWLTAKIFGEVYPSLKVDLEKKAEEVSKLRVLAGMAHPSDIEASKVLAAKVYEALFKKIKFQNDLSAARK